MGSTSHRFDGFFKSEFRVNETVGRSVSYIRDGKLLGGNSGFAHIGTYRFDGDAIAVEVTSRRHNFGATINRCSAPTFRPLRSPEGRSEKHFASRAAHRKCRMPFSGP